MTTGTSAASSGCLPRRRMHLNFSGDCHPSPASSRSLSSAHRKRSHSQPRRDDSRGLTSRAGSSASSAVADHDVRPPSSQNLVMDKAAPARGGQRTAAAPAPPPHLPLCRLRGSLRLDGRLGRALRPCARAVDLPRSQPRLLGKVFLDLVSRLNARFVRIDPALKSRRVLSRQDRGLRREAVLDALNRDRFLPSTEVGPYSEGC